MHIRFSFKMIIHAVSLACMIIMLSCSQIFTRTAKPRDRNDLPVKLTKVKGSVYLFEDFNYTKTVSVVFMDTDGIVFFDSGWTYKSARQIIWNAAQKIKSDFIAVIPTSFFCNRTGGLSTFKGTGIRILMHRKTPGLLYKYWDIEQAQMTKKYSSWRKLDYLGPDAIFDQSFIFFNGKIQVFHFGPGISPDNVVVYFKKERLVYAGELLTTKAYSDQYLDPAGFAKNIQEIKQLDFDYFIDGNSGKLIAKDKLDTWQIPTRSLDD